MVKPAAETRAFDAVLRLGDIAPYSPASLCDVIYLGIRLSPKGDALVEINWLVIQATSPLPETASTNSSHEPLLNQVRQQLIAWFADPTFVFNLPLAAPHTAFQERLRTALCATKPGDTCTYGDLAKHLSSAPRAVGQALGSNPLPIVVPCHRIISAGKNRLTGFDHAREGPKLTLKAWLLDREVCA